MIGNTPHSVLHVCSPSQNQEDSLLPRFQGREGRMEAMIPEQLGQANSQHLFQFLPSLLHLKKTKHASDSSLSRKGGQNGKASPWQRCASQLLPEPRAGGRKQLVSPPQGFQSHL